MTGLALDNSTLIAEVFPKNAKTYKVNGEDLHGWFLSRMEEGKEK